MTNSDGEKIKEGFVPEETPKTPLIIKKGYDPVPSPKPPPKPSPKSPPEDSIKD